MEMEFITIGKFSRFLDAYLMASRIESEGIECFLPHEMLVKPSDKRFVEASEIRLQVKREDAARALRILNAELFDVFGEVLKESDLEM